MIKQENADGLPGSLYRRGMTEARDLFAQAARAYPGRQNSRASREPSTSDREPMTILVVAAFSLTCISYFGSSVKFLSFLDSWGFGGLSASYAAHLASFDGLLFRRVHFSLVEFVCYVVIPAFAFRAVSERAVSRMGLSFGCSGKDRFITAGAIILIVPLVIVFSSSAPFLAKYPLYTPAPHTHTGLSAAVWWGAYFLQIASCEFFFRGFLVHGLSARFGLMAVFVQVVPYTMIHFGKPFAETIGSIAAGVFLGTLSLRTRSIWPGVAIHYTAAFSMEIAALVRKGFF